MYNIIPLILILVSLGAIIIITVRKFSVLANLDVDSIQSEKEAKFKERIVGNRFKRSVVRHYARAARVVGPLWSGLSGLGKKMTDKLIEIKKGYQEENVDSGLDAAEKIEKLFAEAEDLKKEENYAEAEKKIIEIISLNSKNVRAFRMLGRLYLEQKNYEEAKQTFLHVNKLCEDEKDVCDYVAKQANINAEGEKAADDGGKGLRAGNFFDLALAMKELGLMEEATLSLKKALTLEPNNPRYLDTLLEISIINKDKVLALETYKKLKEANPDNGKLEDFKKQIEEID